MVEAVQEQEFPPMHQFLLRRKAFSEGPLYLSVGQCYRMNVSAHPTQIYAEILLPVVMVFRGQ